MAEEKKQENEKERSIRCEDIPGLERYAGRTVVVRRITYGDKADMQEKIVSLGVSAQNGRKPEATAKFNLGKLRLYALIWGIKEAPIFDGEPSIDWSIGLDEIRINSRMRNVRNLDDTTGQQLFRHVLDLNPTLMGQPTDEAKNSEASSKENPTT